MRREVVVKGKGLAGSSDLTLVSRIKPGFVPALDAVTYKSRVRRLLKTLNLGRQSSHEYSLARPLSDAVERIGRIHSVRVVVLEEEDSLLLAATFDGSWESYFRTLWQKTGRLLDAIYCNTEDYVTAWDHSCDEWMDWARRVQRETDFFYGVPSVTVDDQRLWRQHERQARRLVPGDAELRSLRQPVNSVEQVATDVQKEGTEDPPPGDGQPAATGRGERELVKQGLQAIVGLYSLTDAYPPGTIDGLCLGRAAVEFIGDAPDVFFTELDDPVLQNRFERQIDWFKQMRAEPLPAVRERRGLPSQSPQFDRTDIQGGILKPYGEPAPPMTHGAMLLLGFDDREAAARFLDHVLTPGPASLTSDDQSQAAAVKRNLALTFEGLRLCGLAEDELARLPDEFRHGMAARAGQIGDLRTNHPRRWPRPRRFGAPAADPDARVDLAAVHAIVQLRIAAPAAPPSDEYDIALPRHPLHGELSTLLTPGTTLLATESTRRQFRPDGQAQEHFGWADGRSNPHVEPGAQDDRFMLVYPGELLLGYPNEADAGPAPDLSPWLINGSFVAVRKLRQHVDRLDAAVRERVEQTSPDGIANPPNEDTVRGKLMGRRPDGTPMVPGGSAQNNNFSFALDAAGANCPFHAHIRRANPREIGAGPTGRRRPRIARRSMSYGPPYRAGEPPDTERGLLFVAYNASLGEQFEVIQRWLAGGNSTGAGSDVPDPLLGVPENGRRRHFRFEHDGAAWRVHLDGSDDLFADPQPLVTLEWGLYAFAPSMTALRALRDRAESPAVAVAWDAEAGACTIERLLARGDAADAALAWKQVLEDVESVRLFSAAGVWAALRARHGGLLRTPYGVLVAAPGTVREVLADGRRFSVAGYRERMLRSIGEDHLGLDDSGPGCPYRNRSQHVNPAISSLNVSEAFETARNAVHDKFRLMIADAIIKAQDDARYEAPFDPREVVEHVLGDLCERWFGFGEHEIAHPVRGEFRRAGFRWDWRSDAPPTYPGHFSAPSRYIFQPLPGDEVVRFGVAHGQAVHAAALRMVRRLRAMGLNIAARVGAAALRAANDDDAARDFAGAVMGMVPTLDGALRRVLSEWTGDGTLWLQRALRAGSTFANFAAAQALDEPIARALQLRPMPELVWRTSTGEHRLRGSDGRELVVRRGERVVVALVSALQDRLTGADTGLDLMFGGQRGSAGAPTHACPGREAALATLRGVLAAFVEYAGDLRPGAAAPSLVLEGPNPNARAPAPAAATTVSPPEAAPAAPTMTHLSEFLEAADTADGGAAAVAPATSLFGWGDSWLSYRVLLKGQSNLMRFLSDHGSQPVPATPFSESGMKLASMANRPLDDAVYATFEELLSNGISLKAILMSAGGNDCVKSALLQFVRAKSTGQRIDQVAWQNHLRTLRASASTVITNFAGISARFGVQVPVVMHGYDYPVADGRYLFGLSTGAWLKGWLQDKLGYDLLEATAIMKDLIDGLNDMQQSLAAPGVVPVDLRGTLRARFGPGLSDAEWANGGHKLAWENELHPTPEGFTELAAKMAAAISALP